MSFRQPCESVKATPRDETTAQLFSLETSQAVQSYSTAVGLKLGLPWRPGPHGSGGDPALGIFYWFEVANFDLAFLFLFLCFFLHVTFQLFVVCRF
jgi:hypothetical protein